MSASLVGSEMCIRDSTCIPIRGTDPGCAGLRGSQAPAGAPRCFSTMLRTCLLYTSDAADDM
eukprot:15418323-Alexandrium_andersonii.AAC.1